jgi:hypothetical protein
MDVALRHLVGVQEKQAMEHALQLRGALQLVLTTCAEFVMWCGVWHMHAFKKRALMLASRLNGEALGGSMRLAWSDGSSSMRLAWSDGSSSMRLAWFDGSSSMRLAWFDARMMVHVPFRRVYAAGASSRWACPKAGACLAGVCGCWSGSMSWSMCWRLHCWLKDVLCFSLMHLSDCHCVGARGWHL